MEFLGDSILGFIVSRELFFGHPDEQEGKLSKLKSKIVSETYLTMRAKEMDLGKYILLSPEEKLSGGASKPSILSDTVEALICAIYLDRGIASAASFIKNQLLVDYETIVTRNELVNYKSILQEQLQSQSPEHSKIFVVEVRQGTKVLGTGKGSTKKSAHQEAARQACQKLGI